MSTRARVALARRIVRAHGLGKARLVEMERRRLARLARITRLRIARLATARARFAELSAGGARRAPLWSLARNEPPRVRVRAEARVARANRPVARAQTIGTQRAFAHAGTVAPTRSWDSANTTVAAATLGPSARVGERMWVRVVAAGEVDIKPAVAVGRLADRATSAAALNCWGQPVMFVGRRGERWSRAMVCDGKPAGSNEWSAQIYYGGPAKR